MAVDADGSHIATIVNNEGVYISGDSGTSWIQACPNTSCAGNWQVLDVGANGSVLVTGIYGGRVYASVNSGATWKETCPSGTCEDRSWNALACDEDCSNLIIGVWSDPFYTGKRTTGTVPVLNILLE